MTEIYRNFAAKIEEIFLQFATVKKFAVAVSGGCDSLALTFLLDEFFKNYSKKNISKLIEETELFKNIKLPADAPIYSARSNSKLPKFDRRSNLIEYKIELVALTVDHQMRETSNKEAQQLAKLLKNHHIKHVVLQIPKEKLPTKNIEAKLRDLRYEALQEYCQKHKIKILFLGHHLGDVAENFLIRLFRGSGIDGLSTISEIREFENVILARPLLNFNKQQLKDFLIEKKIEWFEDETNQDEKFLRNKIRNFLGSFSEASLIEKRIKNASDEISKTRDLFDQIMNEEAKEFVVAKDNFSFLIHRKKFAKTNQQIALKILALTLMKISKKNYKPRKEKLQRFYEYLIEDQPLKKREFYGCEAKKFDADFAIIQALKIIPKLNLYRN